jgi:NADH dehydrogenase [ubiquinone] 1 alpha subcomplex assembly factor 1
VSNVSAGRLIIDFSNDDNPAWQSLDDRVMGGVSRSRVRLTPEGTAIFEGHVSLDFGGGFSSVRVQLEPLDLSAYHGIELRIFGDGRRYRLRLRSSQSIDGVVHQCEFDTNPDRPEIIRLPFVDFLPVFRGRIVPGAPPLDTGRISQIGLMIVEKREGDFRLEMEWIRAFRGNPG